MLLKRGHEPSEKELVTRPVLHRESMFEVQTVVSVSLTGITEISDGLMLRLRPGLQKLHPLWKCDQDHR